tara:strand:- start:63 stop:215 length:153 start_codon:yes stop_codon:yes gene_type:complete
VVIREIELCVVKKYLDVTLYDQINKLNCIVYSFFGEEAEERMRRDEITKF